MKVIENEYLKVTVEEVGALLTSVMDKRRGKEILWQKDPSIWASQDVVIFPVIGPSKMQIDGIDRTMRQHGFARESKFEVVNHTSTALSLLLQDNEKTWEMYPFHFRLYVHIVLFENQLQYHFDVYNDGTRNMPFMLGSHPGFLVQGTPLLEIPATKHFPYADGVMKEAVDWEEGQMVSLTKELFQKYATIVLQNEKKQTYSLHIGDGYVYDYELDSPLVAVWSHPEKGDYVCVEPWWGKPRYEQMPLEFTQRKGVQICKKHTQFSYQITFRKEK